MPDGPRRTITFLVGEAYSYGPNMLVDLDQAIRAKANAALKLIIANVRVEGPKYAGTILNESQDMLPEKANGDNREFPDGAEELLGIQYSGAEFEALRTKNQALVAEVAVLRTNLAQVQASAEGLAKSNHELKAMIAKLETDSHKEKVSPPTPSPPPEAPEEDVSDEDKVMLVTDEQVLDAIELVAHSTLIGTNQYTRCKKVYATADGDGMRGARFGNLTGIIEGIRDGTFEKWIAELQRGWPARKSPGLFYTLKAFLVDEEVFGDGNGSISIDKIRKALVPLLIKRGYQPILSD